MSDRGPIDPDERSDPHDLRDALTARARRELEPLLALADDAETPFDAERAWSRLAPRLQAPRPVAKRVLRVASGGLGLVAAAGFLAMVVWSSRKESVPVARMTPPGVIDSVRLVDGTVVVLDGNTRFETAPDFGGRTRDVRLLGRAHFRVATDATRPFRVISGGMIAEALGTAFTVAVEEQGRSVEVVVTHGRVAFGPNGVADEHLVLNAGDRARRVGDRVSTERAEGLDEVTAWTTGARRLAGVPLEDALPQLSRWFDLTVVAADSNLARRRITADWRRATAAEALAELTLLLDASATQRGDSVVLRARTRGPSRVR